MSLIKIAAQLQQNTGRRIDFDEAIQHLVSLKESKRPELLDKAFGSLPGLKVQDLYSERRSDERRAKRKYSI